MKKTTIFFLAIGILAMGVGAVGSAVFYQRAKTSMVEVKNEEYTVKNTDKIKELHLKLSGDTDYVIESSATNKIEMEARSSVTEPLKGSLDVNESGDKLTATVNGSTKNKGTDHFQFRMFHIESSHVTLTVPSDIDRVVVDGDATGSVYLSNFTAKELDVDLDHSEISLAGSTAEKVNLTSKSGDIDIFGEATIDELTIKNDHGKIDAYELSGNTIDLTTSTGDIYLTNIKSTTTKAESKSGEFHIQNLRGEADLSGKNGSIYLYGEEWPKELKAIMEHGDIDIELYEEVENISIKAQSDLGDVSIFDTENNTYSRGKDGSKFELKTATGDIYVTGVGAYPEDYMDDDWE
ncbi:DUF4097 family beta strand repeat-containing protein [Enterococcus sp. LJL128]|uniref:DUF4097 family beta strand repeat-containing protein n=1 Tax=Enterococcus sp. LJL51 TaxID=3416656 RepID=UPI003CE86E1B